MAKRREIKLVDLCKINTDAFRHMTPAQLQRAEQKVGSILDFNSKEGDKLISLSINPGRVRKLPERRSRVVNYLLAKFLNELRSARTPGPKLRPDQEAAIEAEWQKKYGKSFPRDEQIRQGRKDEAARTEKMIWDLQARSGCSIKGDEQVARDADRVGDRAAVARIRRKALIR